jgi:branched-chain amino acid transport system substrate-binding protein
VKKLAILRDIRNDYSVDLADVFTHDFKQMDGMIVADESYGEGDTDFSAQLHCTIGMRSSDVHHRH